jgi:hypothetical protein
LDNNNIKNDNQHNDTKHNDTKHNDTKHNDTKHNDTKHNDTKHYYTIFWKLQCFVSFNAFAIYMLSVFRLNVVMLSVAAPWNTAPITIAAYIFPYVTKFLRKISYTTILNTLMIHDTKTISVSPSRSTINTLHLLVMVLRCLYNIRQYLAILIRLHFPLKLVLHGTKLGRTLENVLVFELQSTRRIDCNLAIHFLNCKKMIISVRILDLKQVELNDMTKNFFMKVLLKFLNCSNGYSVKGQRAIYTVKP